MLLKVWSNIDTFSDMSNSKRVEIRALYYNSHNAPIQVPRHLDQQPELWTEHDHDFNLNT